MALRLLVLSLVFCLAACTPLTASPAATSSATLPAADATATTPPATVQATVTSGPTQTTLLPADLLFIQEGWLVRLPKEGGPVERLLGPDASQRTHTGHALPPAGPGLPQHSVTGFEVSEDGRWILVARALPDQAMTELLAYDVVSGAAQALVEGQLYRAMLSPNGQMVAFYDGMDQSVKRVSTAGSAQSILLGICEEGEVVRCADDYRPMRWSPDSTRLAWGDGRTLWISPVDGQPTVALIQPDPSLPEMQQNSFYPVAWSPSGRYLLVQVLHWEGSSLAVLDTQSGRLADLPHTEAYIGPHPNVTWLADDRLLLGHVDLPAHTEPDQAIPSTATVERWAIDPASEAMLVKQDEATIASGLSLYDALPSQRPGGAMSVLVSSAPFEDSGRGLYQLDEALAAHQSVLLPPLQPLEWRIAWSPDGRGAVVWDQSSPETAATTVLLLMPDEGQATDLLPLIGPSAHTFRWLPSIVAP